MIKKIFSCVRTVVFALLVTLFGCCFYGSGANSYFNIAPNDVFSENTSFSLVNPAVKAFSLTPDYDTDYSYTYVQAFCEASGYRKDQPSPVVLKWKSDAADFGAEVRVYETDGGKEWIYRTDTDEIAIYNLVPGRNYRYEITALREDGGTTLMKKGEFVTDPDATRMLRVDGIQNVRDIGGYTGMDGKKVRYERIYRGSAMDDTSLKNLLISEEGKRELLERIGIGTDLDLRGANRYTESALGPDVDFYATPYSYQNYAVALNTSTPKKYFKDMLEYIVAQLTVYEDESGTKHNAKPVYIHCQGGCDRTGTVVFLLLGLLGVNESDLAKEYELSSLSGIGSYRTRNSAHYDYKGMVEAIKSYGDGEFSQCFESFAASCGIAEETVEKFRDIMLEG